MVGYDGDKVVATNLEAVAPLTATLNLSPLDEELTVPSVTETSADSALYKIIEAVPTPFVNVTMVLLPRLMAEAFLLVTVGAVTGFTELDAPEKVKVLSPA
ncbi:hypothetical protein AQAU111925_13195 [Aquirufa aurantiipilula]